MTKSPIRLQSKYLPVYQFIDSLPYDTWQTVPGKYSHRDLSSVRTMLYRMGHQGAWNPGTSIQTRAYLMDKGLWMLTVMKVNGGNEE